MIRRSPRRVTIALEIAEIPCLGLPPPPVFIGYIVQVGPAGIARCRVVLSLAPTFAVFPGGAIALTVLRLYLVGDGLRECAGSQDAKRVSL